MEVQSAIYRLCHCDISPPKRVRSIINNSRVNIGAGAFTVHGSPHDFIIIYFPAPGKGALTCLTWAIRKPLAGIGLAFPNAPSCMQGQG